MRGEKAKVFKQHNLHNKYAACFPGSSVDAYLLDWCQCRIVAIMPTT